MLYLYSFAVNQSCSNNSSTGQQGTMMHF